MTALIIIKFGSDRIKTVGAAFWNFQPHMVLWWQKFQTAIKFLNFANRQKQLQPELSHNQHTYNKVCWNWKKTVGTVAFWKS